MRRLSNAHREAAWFLCACCLVGAPLGALIAWLKGAR